MRIGISAHFWPQVTTGSGQYLRHLASALVSLKGEHELLLIGESGAFADQAPPLPAVEIPRGPLPPGRPSKLWFEQVALPRAARRLRLDLLHIPYLAPPWACPVPVVVTVHDLIPVLLPAYRGSLRKQAYTWLALQGTRRARAIIAVSECTRRDLIRLLGIPPEQIFVTPEAAAPHLRPASATEVRRVRARYRLPQRYVLYLGDSDRRKGVDRLLRAFARWRAAHTDEEVALVIAGPLHPPDGRLYADLPGLARSLGIAETVRFLGPVPEADKAALYTGASCFAFLSEYEGFGLPPLEAMACGTPVLAAARSSLVEVVGEGGVLVDPQDETTVVAMLDRLLRDPAWRAAWRERGLRWAASFTWRRTARLTLAAYEAALGHLTRLSPTG